MPLNHQPFVIRLMVQLSITHSDEIRIRQHDPAAIAVSERLTPVPQVSDLICLSQCRQAADR